MRTILSLYIEAIEAVKVVLQQHIRDGSRLSLTGDAWSASNGDGYLGVTVHWTDA
jgi:zinc finger BED domain-containing protein 1 (E3 SUMO-protein ligase ZBED1)